jgi:3,4-dihydroxy 2-butanone 4-phosphate synthase/GTP cyclohydrolase II
MVLQHVNNVFIRKSCYYLFLSNLPTRCIAVSYDEILKKDAAEYNSCEFDWNCEKCHKSLCLKIVALANFPSRYGSFKILAFENNKDGKDNVMVIKGSVIGAESVLARIHSSCVTGDVLGSLRCDCGDQLKMALEEIEKEGKGVLLYMQQEGRGIGLTNKIKAYMFQDQGADTYEANVLLGFPPDLRQYEVAAAMLKKFDIRSIRLLTNNPQKIKDLESFGVNVEKRVSIEIPPNGFNEAYLKTKKEKFGHILSLP